MASKTRDVKDRSARIEAMRKEQQRQDRRSKVVIWSGAVLAVVLIGGGVGWALVRSASAEKIDGLQTFGGLSSSHVQGTVNYPQTPPVGGNHAGVWLNCGIYASPVVNENAVHDLEHGAVWITYRADLSKADVSKLVAYAKGQTYLDLSPYPGLPAPVVASAWGRQVRLTGPDDPRLQSFVKQFRLGKQSPEPGASCTGGVGTPTG